MGMYQPWLLPVFTLFVLFVTLGVMNVIIGMICDSVLSKAQEMQRMDQQKVRTKKLQLLQRLHDMLSTVDSNDDGRIDAQELKAAMKNDPELRELIETAELPEGFSAEELVLMLDNDGDGTLSYDEFIRTFYRLMDGGDFQQLCLMQMNINTIKHIVVEIKQQSNETKNILATRLQQLDEQQLDGSKTDMATQTCQKMIASTSATVQSHPSLSEEECNESSEDEYKVEDLADQHCSQWHQTCASSDDATLTARLQLSRFAERARATLVEAESLSESTLPSPRVGLKGSALHKRTRSSSRSSAAHVQEWPHPPSAPQLNSRSENALLDSMGQATSSGGPFFEEGHHQHTCL